MISGSTRVLSAKEIPRPPRSGSALSKALPPSCLRIRLICPYRNSGPHARLLRRVVLTRSRIYRIVLYSTSSKAFKQQHDPLNSSHPRDGSARGLSSHIKHLRCLGGILFLGESSFDSGSSDTRIVFLKRNNATHRTGRMRSIQALLRSGRRSRCQSGRRL